MGLVSAKLTWPTVRIGFLTYDLQPPTEECIYRVSREIAPARVKAYPVINHSNQENARFPCLLSDQRGKYIGSNTTKRTPEGLVSNVNWCAAWKCARESDVVVLFGLQGATALLTALFASIMGKTLISVNQTLPLVWEKNRRWWVRWLKQWLLNRCKFHVYQTPISKDVLMSIYGVKKEQLYYAPFEAGASLFGQILGRQSGQRRAIRAELNLSDEVVFLFVGTLHPFKGVPDLIEAAAKMPDDARFICVFAGPEEPRNKIGGTIAYYENLARQLNVGHKVRFLNLLSQDKLGALYWAADVIVLPTHKDCFPKVLVEGALAARPLITTSACGSIGVLVVNGENGFVIEPGRIDALAGAMTQLLDSEMRIKMGRRSKQIVAEVCDKDVETEGFAKAIFAAAQIISTA